MSTFQREALADPEVRRAFEEELLYGEATDTVDAILESVGISQRELAKRLKVTEGRVSQILSGGENLTLRTLATLGWALGIRFELQAVPMADRAGTPAISDPAPPQWLGDRATPVVPTFRTIVWPNFDNPEWDYERSALANEESESVTMMELSA